MQQTLTSIQLNDLHTTILKVCHEMDLPLHYNRKGPKLFTNYQRVALIILFLRSKKNLRDFIRELCESRWVQWLSLKEIPGKSTLHDWLQYFNLEFLRKILTLFLRREKPSLMAIDGTGIDSWQRSRQYEKKINDPNMPFTKLDILIDTDSLLIHDFVVRNKPRHDILGAKSMIKRIRCKNLLILGDKGYDCEELHKMVFRSKNRFYAPVRDYSRIPKGFFRRKCVEKIKQYSKRNTVESVIHSLKTKIISLKSKKSLMKKKEMAWKILVYNFERKIKLINKLIKLLMSSLFRTRPYFLDYLATCSFFLFSNVISK